MGSCCLQLLALGPGAVCGAGVVLFLSFLPFLSSPTTLPPLLWNFSTALNPVFSLFKASSCLYIRIQENNGQRYLSYLRDLCSVGFFFRIPTNFPALELSPHVSSCQSGWCKTMMLFPRGIAWCHIANFSRPFRFWLTPLGIFICSYLYISFRIPFLNSLLTPTHFWSTKLTSDIPNSFLTYQQLLSYPINFISQLSVIQAGSFLSIIHLPVNKMSSLSPPIWYVMLVMPVN